MAYDLSTSAKIAAVALTAASAVFGSLSASAQEMAAANSGPDFAACDAIKDQADSAQCYHDAKIAFYKQSIAASDAKIAAAEKRAADADKLGAAADARSRCADEVGELRGNPAYGDKATEIARKLVKDSGKPALEYGACALRDGIRAGLTRLKLLPARVSLN